MNSLFFFNTICKWLQSEKSLAASPASCQLRGRKQEKRETFMHASTRDSGAEVLCRTQSRATLYTQKTRLCCGYSTRWRCFQHFAALWCASCCGWRGRISPLLLLAVTKLDSGRSRARTQGCRLFF